MCIQRIIRYVLSLALTSIFLLHNRGTIDKYMGDAVMAFWGAPLEDKQHALHALNSAMDIKVS